jgi:transposase-like protein
MAMKNKYIIRAKISEAKFRQLVGFFCVDLNATQIARLTGLNRNTVNRLLQGIRKRIAFACEAESQLSGENEHSHINDIESFWAYAKTRLARFRGMQKHTFYFHLKECEFRFNHRHQDLQKRILKMCRNFPLC